MNENEMAFKRAMNEANNAAWEEDWKKAADLYSQALEFIPDHPKALVNLGLALFELQDYSEALLSYQRAAKQVPQDPLPWGKIAEINIILDKPEDAVAALIRSGEIYLRSRSIQKAIQSWEQAAGLAPDNIQLRSRLALIYERTKDNEKAVDEYLAVASILQSNGELEKAIQAATHAEELLPNSSKARQAIALLKDFKPIPMPTEKRAKAGLTSKRQKAQTVNKGTKALAEEQITPIHLALQKSLMYLADMVFEGPEEEMEIPTTTRGLQAIMGGAFSRNSPQDRQRALLHLSQVIDLQTNRHYEQAARELKLAIDAGLEHPAAYFDLGYLYNETERLQSAIKLLRNAVTHTDFALGARLLLGGIYSKMQQYRQAATEYLEALKLADGKTVHPKQIDYLYQMYESIIEENQHQKDEEKQQRLCENIESLLNQPDWFERIMGARKQVPSTDQNGYPLPLAEMLTEASSSGIIESMSKIYALANMGNPRSAMEEAYFALDKAPYYLPLHQYMAKLLVEQGEIKAAINKLKIIARMYAIRGDAGKAVDLYRNIIEISSLEFSVREDLINLLIANDEIEDAIYECTEMAEMYYSLADLENAREAYTKALPLSQNSRIDRSLQVKLLKRISDIDQQNLDWEQALMINERIRRLKLDDEETRLNLIEINLKLGKEEQAVAELDNYLSFLLRSKKREQAIEFLENLVFNNPGEIPFRRRLADLYRKTGRISDAIEQLDAIGEILLEQGNKNGAVQVIESILKLNPPNKADYQTLLESIRSGKI